MSKYPANSKRFDPYKNFKFRLVQRDYPATWDDVVLANEKRVLIERMLGRERGIALFSGHSGTGRTVAAEVIADELGRDLFRVDLSRIVGRYVGETEKHLDRILAAASDNGAVLFFDEADALFGKRTGVSDSHDRYANQEVAYLMQRIQDYDGLVILAASNGREIHPALLGSIATVIEFP